MRKTINYLFTLGLVIPIAAVFWRVFTGSGVWGDAPYFYPENFKSFLAEPYGWSNFDHNFGGPTFALWLYPVLFINGALHALFNFKEEVIIPLVFYLPSIFGAVLGSFYFAKYLKASKIVGFFTALVFTVNTYYLLLVDGGQLGVVLSYGIFPGALLFLRKLYEKFTLKNFLLCLFSFFFLFVSDPRIALICLGTFLLWLLIESIVLKTAPRFSNLKAVFFALAASLGLSSYWIIPMARSASLDNFSQVGGSSGFTSLLNAFLLYQPHWPYNEFGKITYPAFSFILIPFLIFGSLLFKKPALVVFSACFLVLAFLVKGETPPAGIIYQSFVQNFPLGYAFRDSTKFFIPLLLFAGFLIGNTVEKVTERFQKWLKRFLVLSVWAYLIYLVNPALTGSLQGVLAGRQFNDDFAKVQQEIVESSSARTAWFPDKPPFAFRTEDYPAIDAKNLVEKRAFASLNVGTFDRFNFLNNGLSYDFMRLSGVKYLAFPGNFRVRNNVQEQEEYKKLLTLVGSSSLLQKKELGTSFPLYELADVKPRLFAVDKAFFIVGSDDIYKKLKDADSRFSAGNQLFVFAEDGSADLQVLNEVAPSSATLVFNRTTSEDLVPALVQKYFSGPKNIKKTDWAAREDYLRWKYELLVNGVDTILFDFKKGIAFSTKKKEKIIFLLPVDKSGEHTALLRYMSPRSSRDLKVFLDGKELSWQLKKSDKFEWMAQENVFLEAGEHSLEVENGGELQVVNTAAIIPQAEWEEAKRQVDFLTKKFPVIYLNGDDRSKLEEISLSSKWHEVNYEKASPVRFNLKEKLVAGQWLILSESYHPQWSLRKVSEKMNATYSLTAYSFLNGFYIPFSWNNAEVYFSGQQDVRGGEYFSILTFLALAIFTVYKLRF